MKEFVSFSLFLGTALLTYSILQPFQTLLALRLRGKRRRKEKPFDPYDVEKIPWALITLLSAAFGVFLAALLFWERNPFLSAVGLLASYFPHWARSYIIQRRKAENERAMRFLLMSLTDVFEAHGGLTPALLALASTPLRNRVMSRLAFHLGVGRNGTEAIAQLAKDFQSEVLGRVVERLKEAEEGLTTPKAILEEETARLGQESITSLREKIGRAPMELLLPSIFLLLPPILILALYPPVSRILALISGTGMGW
jgi:tight adherence protein C